MKRMTAMLAALCLVVATVAAEERMLLAQALARLNAAQTQWTADVRAARQGAGAGILHAPRPR